MPTKPAALEPYRLDLTHDDHPRVEVAIAAYDAPDGGSIVCKVGDQRTGPTDLGLVLALRQTHALESLLEEVRGVHHEVMTLRAHRDPKPENTSGPIPYHGQVDGWTSARDRRAALPGATEMQAHARRTIDPEPADGYLARVVVECLACGQRGRREVPRTFAASALAAARDLVEYHRTRCPARSACGPEVDTGPAIPREYLLGGPPPTDPALQAASGSRTTEQSPGDGLGAGPAGCDSPGPGDSGPA